MPIYAPVFEALRDAEIPFLVVGGHAVVLHGHQRNTFDLDLLISEVRLPQTKEVLLRLGYEHYFESGAFLQLTPSTNLPPVHLPESAPVSPSTRRMAPETSAPD